VQRVDRRTVLPAGVKRILHHFSGNRDHHGEFRAFSQRTGDTDLAVVQLDQFAGDRQTESGSAKHARTGHVYPVKAVENPGQVLFVDAKTCIGYLDIHVVNQIADIDFDRPALFGVLDGVTDQVGDDALHRGPVDKNERDPRQGVTGHVDRLVLGLVLHPVDDLADNLGEVQELQADTDAAAVDT